VATDPLTEWLARLSTASHFAEPAPAVGQDIRRLVAFVREVQALDEEAWRDTQAGFRPRQILFVRLHDALAKLTDSGDPRGD
jgi:hypothetical protein